MPRITTAEFAGRTWIANDIEGKATNERVSSSLEFLDEARVAGNLGCNRFNAPYVANHPIPGNLKIGHVAATRRACAEAAMTQELRFAAALEATRRARIDGRVLLLMDESGAVLVRLSAAGSRSAP